MALTHMRGPNDRRLAEQATGIDLILGGHDHDYFSQKVFLENFVSLCKRLHPLYANCTSEGGQGLLDSDCRNVSAVAAMGSVGVVSDAGVQVTNVVLLHVSLAMLSIVRLGFIFSN